MLACRLSQNRDLNWPDDCALSVRLNQRVLCTDSFEDILASFSAMLPL